MPDNNTTTPEYRNEAYFLQIIDLMQQILAALSGSNDSE